MGRSLISPPQCRMCRQKRVRPFGSQKAVGCHATATFSYLGWAMGDFMPNFLVATCVNVLTSDVLIDICCISITWPVVCLCLQLMLPNRPSTLALSCLFGAYPRLLMDCVHLQACALDKKVSASPLCQRWHTDAHLERYLPEFACTCLGPAAWPSLIFPRFILASDC